MYFLICRSNVNEAKVFLWCSFVPLSTETLKTVTLHFTYMYLCTLTYLTGTGTYRSGKKCNCLLRNILCMISRNSTRVMKVNPRCWAGGIFLCTAGEGRRRQLPPTSRQRATRPTTINNQQSPTKPKLQSTWGMRTPMTCMAMQTQHNISRDIWSTCSVDRGFVEESCIVANDVIVSSLKTASQYTIYLLSYLTA